MNPTLLKYPHRAHKYRNSMLRSSIVQTPNSWRCYSKIDKFLSWIKRQLLKFSNLVFGKYVQCWCIMYCRQYGNLWLAILLILYKLLNDAYNAHNSMLCHTPLFLRQIRLTEISASFRCLKTNRLKQSLLYYFSLQSPCASSEIKLKVLINVTIYFGIDAPGIQFSLKCERISGEFYGANEYSSGGLQGIMRDSLDYDRTFPKWIDLKVLCSYSAACRLL